MPSMAKPHRTAPNRVTVMLDDQDLQALEKLVTAEKLKQSDVVRRLIRQAAKVLSQSSAA